MPNKKYLHQLPIIIISISHYAYYIKEPVLNRFNHDRRARKT